MMAFSGPSIHRCRCFGEADGPNGSWYPCPPDLCEAEALLVRVAELEKALQTTRAAWDAHMETCPQPPVLLPGPTPEDILRWLNAPSDTASGAPSATGGSDE
jgi:hypothetical protein